MISFVGVRQWRHPDGTHNRCSITLLSKRKRQWSIVFKVDTGSEYHWLFVSGLSDWIDVVRNYLAINEDVEDALAGHVNVTLTDADGHLVFARRDCEGITDGCNTTAGKQVTFPLWTKRSPATAVPMPITFTAVVAVFLGSRVANIGHGNEAVSSKYSLLMSFGQHEGRLIRRRTAAHHEGWGW